MLQFRVSTKNAKRRRLLYSPITSAIYLLTLHLCEKQIPSASCPKILARSTSISIRFLSPFFFFEELPQKHFLHLDNTHPSIPERKAFRFFASQCLNVVLLSISRYSTHQSKATFLVLGGTSQIGVDTSSLLFPCSLPFVTERFQRDTHHFLLRHHM